MQPQSAEIEYPESDGKPMSDNTLQAFWMILLYDNLDASPAALHRPPAPPPSVSE